MKKLFYLLSLMLTTLAYTQTVNYTPDNTIFANPERGFYQHEGTDSSPYDPLNLTSLRNKRINENITLVLRIFYMEDFLTSNISTSYLNNVTNDFTIARNAGVKLIVRFAYSDGANSGSNNPTKAKILTHIQQLAPIMQANKDVIACVQAGFIGAWGEWYYTDYFGQGNPTAAQTADRNEILQAILTNFPNQIQVRTPLFKQKYIGNAIALTNAEAYNGSDKSRIGHHNDSFLSDNSEQGTYSGSNPNMLLERAYVKEETKYTVMGGEANEFPTPFTNCTSATQAMNAYNYSYFNSVGYAGYPDGIISHWSDNLCLDEMKKNLGYRFVLNSSNITLNNADLTITLNIDNVGYARPYNLRKTYLVLKNTTTNVINKYELNSDIRTWENNVIINQTITTGLPDGTYKCYLWMPDISTTLENKPEYSIRLANANVWETTTGYNNLNQTINILNSGCANTIWNGTAWSNGTPLANITAIINGPFIVNTGSGFDCCNLIVNSDLTINENGFVTVQNDITVNTNGNLLVKSGGKLIPVNDTSMAYGNIKIERTTTPMKQYDYTYWSSPINNGIISNILLPTNWETNHSFRFDTQNFYDVESTYNGTFLNNLPDGQDDADPQAWQLINGNDLMIPAKGYAAMIESLPSTGIYPRTETVLFNGILNTGIITIPMVMSQNSLVNNDDFNLVGNPYSSSIYVVQFINANLPNISGTVMLWSHTGTLSNSYPGLFQLNFSDDDYAYVTNAGSTAAAFGGKQPSAYIRSGQGFFVEAENTGPLVFKPLFMAAGYDNSTSGGFGSGGFFRNAENNKVWLNITTELGLFSQQLISYDIETDLENNKGWDAKISPNRNPLLFYSIQNGDKYKIQSRGIFNNEDIVKIGYYSAIAETFTISVDSIQGINPIYIKDNGVIHSLPYTFTSEIGEFNDRFEIVYSNLLNVNNPTDKKIRIYPNPTTNNLFVKNFNGKIIKVYDILGKTYKVEYSNYDKKTIILNTNTLNRGLYLLRLDNKTIRFIKK